MAAAIAAENQGVFVDGEPLEVPRPALALLPQMPQEVIAMRLPGDHDPIAGCIFGQEPAIPAVDDYVPDYPGLGPTLLRHSCSPPDPSSVDFGVRLRYR